MVIGGLALSAYTLYQKDFQARQGGTIKLVHGRELAMIELTAAGTAESEAKSLIGTYSETNMKRFQDLKVVYANETVYCLQVHKERRDLPPLRPQRLPSRRALLEASRRAMSW